MLPQTYSAIETRRKEYVLAIVTGIHKTLSPQNHGFHADVVQHLNVLSEGYLQSLELLNDDFEYCWKSTSNCELMDHLNKNVKLGFLFIQSGHEVHNKTQRSVPLVRIKSI